MTARAPKQTRALRGFVHSALSPHTPTTVIPDTEITAVKSAGNNTGSAKQEQEFISGKRINNPGEWRADSNPLLDVGGGGLFSLVFASFCWGFFQEMEPMIKQTLVCETEAEVKRAQTVSTRSQTLRRVFNEHHTSPR